ncbi:uncharacterized protein MONOS_887 [Monocercomonoides exilis]|uniref:uncharacterized protein n=1 Tax=Monocercomonoides exilis TaxID=2049356 RepID=UPI0035594745|nr:hypothetical protein MONOS_887 [Monocercomonoides exilis]|eukprot:MONOS_887.1-p1 / transcript=MONOS_887.1 / gene=MONOS_887 / organism=Monocercomonoides_exilis_PA203 / gene_product=unspecified product / transcript_product=unspecified product / location=Mono_scaffold00014:235092-235835(-) / protein_length=117 / sequence_SO=supercontig / SO=protein_coding / is_pseudo=false
MINIVEKRMDENHLDDSITLNDTFDCAKCIVECTKRPFFSRIVRSDKLSMIQEIISCIANIVICIIEQTEILVSCVKANVREQLALKNAKTRFLVEAKLDELFDKLEEMRQFEEGT